MCQNIMRNRLRCKRRVKADQDETEMALRPRCKDYISAKWRRAGGVSPPK